MSIKEVDKELIALSFDQMITPNEYLDGKDEAERESRNQNNRGEKGVYLYTSVPCAFFNGRIKMLHQHPIGWRIQRYELMA
jgi:hypothetical protein